jgi:hypothetical protein
VQHVPNDAVTQLATRLLQGAKGRVVAADLLRRVLYMGLVVVCRKGGAGLPG